MTIAETLPDHHRINPQPDHQPQDLLSQIDSLISQTETLRSICSIPETIPTALRQTLSDFCQLRPFSGTVKLRIANLSCRLWNACFAISNHLSSDSSSSSSVAKLRHVAADMLALATDVVGLPFLDKRPVSFYYETGLAWHGLGVYDLASTCFEKATEMAGKIIVNEIVYSDEERNLLFKLNLARSRTAWELSDWNLTATLLSQCKELLLSDPEHYKALASQYSTFAVALAENESSRLSEVLELMNEALDLLDKGLAAATAQAHSVELKELKSKTLRLKWVAHLQKKDYESVIEYVKNLRKGIGNEDASLPVLAMKAWLGLQRYGEAQKELKGMATNNRVPESLLVSSVVEYFEAVVASEPETAKQVFFELLGRCQDHVSAGAAAGVVRAVIGYGVDRSGEGLQVRAKVIAELVSDDRVVALLSSDANAEQRKAIHSVLWNCAVDHFWTNNYDVSAEMFEKSLLYVPHDLESRILQPKLYRALSSCYLSLSQLDRAHESINEVEKLEPNIDCAFLKFKLCLQKDDQGAAINQIQAMRSCLGFSPNILVLSAREAIACHALPVAATALSHLLNLYSTGRSIAVREVVALRVLISILREDPEKKTEILKHLKWAHARATELGTDCFFGKGETGRQEKDWFGANSYKFGLLCVTVKNYELGAEFLRLASIFYRDRINAVMEEGSSNMIVVVCRSLILMVTATIASEGQRKFTLTDTERKQAVELLQKADKMIYSLLSETREGNMSKIDPEPLFFMHTLNAYDIYGGLDGLGGQQLEHVRRFANSKACKPKHLLQLGFHASHGTRPNHEVAFFALNECLSTLLSSPSPDYQEAAPILQRLVARICKGDSDGDDDVVVMHNMYKQAYQKMVGSKGDGVYPTEEGRWLAMTACDRAEQLFDLARTSWRCVLGDNNHPPQKALHQLQSELYEQREREKNSSMNSQLQVEKTSSVCHDVQPSARRACDRAVQPVDSARAYRRFVLLGNKNHPPQKALHELQSELYQKRKREKDSSMNSQLQVEKTSSVYHDIQPSARRACDRAVQPVDSARTYRRCILLGDKNHPPQKALHELQSELYQQRQREKDDSMNYQLKVEKTSSVYHDVQPSAIRACDRVVKPVDSARTYRRCVLLGDKSHPSKRQKALHELQSELYQQRQKEKNSSKNSQFK